MKLGQILKKWRFMSDLDLRSASEQMGIGAATLSRIEKGAVPDGYTFVKLLTWMCEQDLPAEKAANATDNN